MDEDATGKERVAHQVRRRAPLRRENSESTSDTGRKRTSGAEGAPYAKTQGGAAAPGRPSLYPPLFKKHRTWQLVMVSLQQKYVVGYSCTVVKSVRLGMFVRVKSFAHGCT